MADIKIRLIAINEASKPIDDVGHKLKDLGKAAEDSKGGFKDLLGTLDSVAGAFGIGLNIGNVIGGLKNAVMASFNLAAAIEQSQMAFSTMLGSAEAATTMLQNLQKFADKTPFEFMELQAAAKRMMAYGFAAEEVIPTLKAVGDAAAALGGGGEMVQRITTALGQMSAKGKVSGEELRQLAESGIPALRMLADGAGVTTGEMQKMVENGMIPAAEGIKVLLAGMEKDFGGLMAKQADTASGKLSTMKDALQGVGTEVGKTFIPAVKAGADIVTYFSGVIKDQLRAENEASVSIEMLKEAYKKGYITAEQYADVIDTRVITAQNDVGFAFTRVRETISDTTAATDLLRVAGVNQARDMEQQETRFTGLYKSVHETTVKLDLNTDAVDKNKEALRLHADSFDTLSGASKEYDTDSEALGKTHQKHLDDIAKLTKEYGRNHAAILSGKGTVVDNTRQIESASIAASRAEISFGKLNERYGNQDNINKYNDGISELNTQQDQLNKSFADGKIDGDKLAEGLNKISDKQKNLKDRLDDSQMSTEDYNLSVRQHTIDLADSGDKMAALIAKHGEGYTAAELAAGATATYNTKLAEMKKLLEEDAIADAALQAQTALRIKQGLVLDEIKIASEGGLTEAELANIQVIQTAMGLQDDAAINGMLSVQRGATLLAGFRKQYAADFDKGNTDSASVYATQADLIGRTTNDKVIPTLADFEQSAKDARKELRELATEYNSIQSKDVELRITTIRQTIDQKVATGMTVAAAVASVSSGVVAGAKAHGGTLMPNSSYLVGEQGPEIFTPSMGGTVYSNQKSSNMFGGGNSNLRIGTLIIQGVQTQAQLYQAITAEAKARGLTFGVN